MRLTEYHCGKAVLMSKELDSMAADKLAKFEDIGLNPEHILEIGKSLGELSETIIILAALSKIGKDVHKQLELIATNLKEISEVLNDD